MKILWKFETDSPEDMMEMNRCLQASDAFNYIWDILHNTKKGFIWNIEANKYETQEHLLDDIYETLWERLKDKGIDLYKLIE